MLLFNIMYSYIISICIIYLWYHYFFRFFFAFTFKASSLLKTKTVPDRVVFSKHGIAIGIFSFFICFSKFFLMVNNASIIIGTTSLFYSRAFEYLLYLVLLLSFCSLILSSEIGLCDCYIYFLDIFYFFIGTFVFVSDLIRF